MVQLQLKQENIQVVPLKISILLKKLSSKDKIDWGNVNRPISSEIFDSLYNKVINYLKAKDELFVFKGFAGADHSFTSIHSSCE